MSISQHLLQKYADLIVRTGANVQPGQIVLLTIAVEQHEFAAMVIEACYKAGAKKVNVDWTSDVQSRLNYLYAEQETLSRVLPWEEAKMKQMVEDLPCRIFIESEDPDAMKEIDPQKLSDVTQSRAKVMKPYRNAIEGKHQWVIAAYPSEKWAKKCFPEDDDAMDKLWEAILKTVRVCEDNDPVAAWKDHTDFIEKKAAWLNEQGFASLRYRSANGTDFRVDLIPGAKWEGAGATNPLNDAFYIPNMPTEECFISPKRGEAEGIVYSSMPLSYQGQLIENFWMRFENGKAVEVGAEKGAELLKTMVNMDGGAGYLGECALVPQNSPICQSGLLFYNTLFDENASCHLAMGRGYADTIRGFETKTLQECREMGLNDSMIHVDFMIGCDTMNIDATCADGSVVPVFRNGNWAF